MAKKRMFGDGIHLVKHITALLFAIISSVSYGDPGLVSLDVPGQVIMWAGRGGEPPVGWLIANGQCVSKSKYSKLYEVIGDNYTVDSKCKETEFELPDLRSRFVRGANNDTDTGALEEDMVNTDSLFAKVKEKQIVATGDQGQKRVQLGRSWGREEGIFTLAVPYLSDYKGAYDGKGYADRPHGSGRHMSLFAPSQEAGIVAMNGKGGNETRPKNIRLTFLIRH